MKLAGTAACGAALAAMAVLANSVSGGTATGSPPAYAAVGQLPVQGPVSTSSTPMSAAPTLKANPESNGKCVKSSPDC